MKYEKARDFIKTGDLLACQGNWWFSRLIRLYTRQPVSHVGLAVWVQFADGKPRLCILEAVEGHGVRLHPLQRYLEKSFWPHGAKIFWQTLVNKKIDGDKLIDFELQKWGDNYVSSAQFVVALPLFRRLHRLWHKVLLLDPGKWHCSRLVTEALKSQGYNGIDKESVIVTPGDVSNFSCWGKKVELEK
jgi:hypothetical protein